MSIILTVILMLMGNIMDFIKEYIFFLGESFSEKILYFTLQRVAENRGKG